MTMLFLVFLSIWGSGFAVNVPGCFPNKPYPMVIDATEERVGDIYSPGFDEGKYPNSAICDYTIKTSPGYIIKLTFVEFDLEPSNKCLYDQIYLLDGPTRKGEDLGDFCGKQAPPFPVVSTKNGLHISFRSDLMIEGKGFHLRYEAILPTEICPQGQHKCSNNRCYTTEQKCNGKDDCLDGSDEEGCNLPLPSYRCGVGPIKPIEPSETGMDRVIGGIEARPHSWPWQADMQLTSYYPNSHQCGGTLIHPQWVMTAAHCIPGFTTSERWRVHLGNHNRFEKDKYEQIRLVQRIILYPGYTGNDIDGKQVDMFHDIALMKLNAPVEITNGVRPACLPTENFVEKIGTKCQATGWGQTRGTGSSNALKQAELYVQTEESCPTGKRFYSICVDTKKGIQGVCHGDSGGPLSCKVNGEYLVLGVASYVTQTNMLSGLCAVGGTMNVYNRVANKVSWINTMIMKYS